MGEHSSDPAPAWFRDAFDAAAGAEMAVRFDQYMEIALYHPAGGYYRRPRMRVGTGPETDFYTASTSAPVFGDLVVAAATTLLGTRDPHDFRFVEIGAEPGCGILQGIEHPFSSYEVRAWGDTTEIDRCCVLFSNELFDAQPFRRFVKREAGWREVYVTLSSTGFLAEIEYVPPDASFLPPTSPPGYRIDASFAATDFAKVLVEQPWQGLFLAFDYGKSWETLVSDTPNGTARAYYRHTQSNDLLARPGEQDLTCHVCWDWLDAALGGSGFAPARLESQEAFFVKHAASRIEALMRADAAIASPRKRSLMQLLHPAHLGQKFEVLHAQRFHRQNCP